MKLLEKLRSYISISNSPSAIDFNAVFQPNYSTEAWLKMFQSIDLDKKRRESLSRLVSRILKKTAEEKRELIDILCKPKLKIFVKKEANQELESYEISRQLVIYILSCSEENLKNIAQVLNNIRNT